MKQIIRRYLTNNPRLKAARELKELMVTLPSITESEFKERYVSWRNFWADTLNKRSLLKSGKTQYTHKRFICGFFLALIKALCIKKQDTQ